MRNLSTIFNISFVLTFHHWHHSLSLFSFWELPSFTIFIQFFGSIFNSVSTRFPFKVVLPPLAFLHVSFPLVYSRVLYLLSSRSVIYFLFYSLSIIISLFHPSFHHFFLFLLPFFHSFIVFFITVFYLHLFPLFILSIVYFFVPFNLLLILSFIVPFPTSP